MISIITRCYNRLEYTIQCVNRVQSLGGDYEHIIIDNNSQDGTYEWFRWMNANTKHLDKLRYFRMKDNVGDWTGMATGLKYAKGDYIVQLDNDILVNDKTWLQDMVTILEKTGYKSVMLKRRGAIWVLGHKQTGEPQTIGNIDGLEVIPVERSVACYMTSREIFEMLVQNVHNKDRSKYEVRNLIGNTAKILNRTCEECEYKIQRIKYNPKNKNVHARL
jgi:glycosyltransferase involved in cell wall biosynthesis